MTDPASLHIHQSQNSFPDIKPQLSIISVNYNNGRLLSECIARTMEKLSNISYGIILVDNCSTDDSYEFLCQSFLHNKFVRVVKSDSNGGFGYGCNFGAKLATSPILWFLNSDAWILNPDGLTDVFVLLKNHDTGLVGSSVYLNDGSQSPQGGGDVSFFYLFLSSFRFGQLIRQLPVPIRTLITSRLIHLPTIVGRYFKSFQHAEAQSAYLTPSVGGASFLIKKSIYDALQGFDEGFFLYDEDGDLAVRATKAGYKNYVCPSLAIQTFVSATTSKLNKNHLKQIKLKSRLRLVNKHFSGFKRILLIVVTNLTWKLL
jgi:GT2 family glycosyltransferase